MKNLSYEAYLDKVWGGWTGKCIGGTVGWFEGIKQITHFNVTDLLPEKMVPNDDLDVQLVWIDVLMTQGVYFTSRQLMDAWIAQYDCNFGEYGYARRNALRGVYPPESGRYANSFYITGMGCPIRAEIWGMICPGDADAAARFAWKDGILDHEGESVWAEQYIAAMVAEAFLEADIRTLLLRNLRFLPECSLTSRCVRAAMAGYDAGFPWQESWEALRVGYSHPDCTYTPLNIGILALALLHGGGDLDATLAITANAGWDIDCTCSTAAALLGLIAGHTALPARWVGSVGEQVSTLARVRHDMSTIRRIAEWTGCICQTVQNEGLSPACVEGFPDQPCAPAVRHDADIGFAGVSYPDKPAVRAGDTVRVLIPVKGDEAWDVSIRLSLELPEGWHAEYGKDITLPAGQTLVVEAKVTVPADARRMADTNRIGMTLAEGNTMLARDDFGLCGGCIAYITAPVSDSYLDWLAGQPLPEKRYLRTSQQTVILPELGEEWGNHRVDLHKAYVAEDFSTLESAARSLGKLKRVGILEDRYAISEHFGLTGPACSYVLQVFESPVERTVHVFIGSDIPVKLWINGRLLFTQQDSRMWFPNNNVVEVRLNTGVNYFVLKLARTGLANCTTVAFREKPVLWGYDSSPFIVDLATLSLEGLR